mmetsp:Transcript_32310/g.65974  ORF Transcript_32310/g.65974 Transcript_32310/m.65974 type:complete len:431 (+) Transcript_32310:91-1383(+)
MLLSKATALIPRQLRQNGPLSIRPLLLSLPMSAPFSSGPTRAPSSYSNKKHGQSVAAGCPDTLLSKLKSINKPSSSIWDKNDLSEIMTGNAAYRASKLAKNPEYFKNLAKGQSPQYLLIGCSDSRVGAQELMQLDQGQLFIHRNIANVFVPTDLNLLSVIFYSVNVLKVKDIIVLGHYECGGVRAASQNQDLGLIEHWLSNIRDVQRLHKEELAGITDGEKRHRRLVELNVQEQCFKLYGNNIIQQMQAKTGRPRIHGLVYDIADGKLINLNVDFKQIIRKYRDIYTVADFDFKHTPLSIDRALEKDADLATGNATTDDMKKDFESGLDRLVVIRPMDGEDVGEGMKALRPMQCRGTTSIKEVKLAIENLTGMAFDSQGLYMKKAGPGGVVAPAFDAVKDDNMTLDEAGVVDILELELKEEFVPKAFRKP